MFNFYGAFEIKGENQFSNGNPRYIVADNFAYTY
jgi:hypothetical protein